MANERIYYKMKLNKEKRRKKIEKYIHIHTLTPTHIQLQIIKELTFNKKL